MLVTFFYNLHSANNTLEYDTTKFYNVVNFSKYSDHSITMTIRESDGELTTLEHEEKFDFFSIDN